MMIQKKRVSEYFYAIFWNHQKFFSVFVSIFILYVEKWKEISIVVFIASKIAEVEPNFPMDELSMK
jgi:hypothetical protein